MSFGAYLRFEDGRAQKLSGPQLRQDVVGLNERECRRLSLDARLRHNLEKIQSVLTGEVGDRPDLALVPEGTGLRRYGLYLDLHDPGRAEFLADGAQTVKPGQRLVAREGTDERLWTALQQACGNVVGRRRAG